LTAPPDDSVIDDRPDAPLSPTVKALGLVSLCTDFSSEMVYPINPIFLTTVLGASPAVIGLIEGVAESVASLLKLYSGYLSDRMGARKPLTLWGYGLAAISKPLIGVAGAWSEVFAARLLDRTGKGLRAAPRDALIADSTGPKQRGRAFGLHRSLDTAGAVLGPLVGYAFLRFYPLHLRWIYFVAFAPALVGLFVLATVVREKAPARKMDASPPRFLLTGLSPAFRRYLLAIGIFGLGNSSDAFLLLRARGMGVPAADLLLLYALFNCVEAGLGYATGGLSDRIGRRPLIAAGWGVFALVYLGFALCNGPLAASLLFLLYGFYYTLTQGSQKALAADMAHPDRRGAEMGAFHLLNGIAALPASLIAGYLYAHVSPSAPFFAGAVSAALAVIFLLRVKK
jgi:MFS family permease